MTLGHKVFLLVCMAVAPVALVQFHNVSSLTATFDDAAASIARSALGNFRESYAGLLREVSDAALGARGDDPCAAAEDAMARSPQAPLVGFAGFDRAGAVSCSTQQASGGIGAASDLARRAFEAGRAPVVPWHAGERRGIALATAPDGRPDGTVLVALIDERWMGRSGAATTLASASLVLAWADGEIVSDHPRTRISRLDPAVAEAAGGVRSGLANGKWEDRHRRLVAYGTAPLPGTPFPTVVLDREFVAVASDRAHRSAALALGASLLAAVAAAWLGVRRFVGAPVEALLAAARHLQAGERGVRVGRVDGDEMSRLAEAFDRASEAIEAAERARDEREEAVARAAEGRRILEAVMETIPDAVFVKDTKGFFAAANPGAAALHGVPRERMVGMHESELAPSLEAAEVAARCRKEAIATGRPVSFETPQPHAGYGEQRIYEIVYAPMRGEGGEVVGLSCVGRDVTDRKRAQEALAAAMARVAEVSRSKTEFLTATSHDLRQPAQAAMLFAETLAHEVQDPGKSRVLGDLRRSLSSLNGMLDGLLDISRLEAGAIVPEPRDFPLAPALSELRANLRPKADLKGIALRVEASDVAVRSDPVLLGRMLRNLMENAIRYTEEGRVTVSCGSSAPPSPSPCPTPASASPRTTCRGSGTSSPR